MIPTSQRRQREMIAAVSAGPQDHANLDMITINASDKA